MLSIVPMPPCCTCPIFVGVTCQLWYEQYYLAVKFYLKSASAFWCNFIFILSVLMWLVSPPQFCTLTFMFSVVYWGVDMWVCVLSVCMGRRCGVCLSFQLLLVTLCGDIKYSDEISYSSKMLQTWLQSLLKHTRLWKYAVEEQQESLLL